MPQMTPDHRYHRHLLGHRYYNWNHQQCSHVIFADESRVGLYHSDRPVIWMRKCPNPFNNMTKNSSTANTNVFPILRTIGNVFSFDSSAKCPPSECLFDTIQGASNSMGVDVLKLRLIQHDTFCNIKQQDFLECLRMNLILKIVYYTKQHTEIYGNTIMQSIQYSILNVVRCLHWLQRETLS